jgi:environmental stress-induced protein Ves
MTGTIIRRAALTESLWANRAGRKADIAFGPGWLVGFAWLDQDAPFSDYAGHDRTITLLDGAGFTLVRPDGARLAVTRPFTPAAFDGAGPLDCRLADGPCVVLNALSDRAAFTHEVAIIDPSGLAPIASGLLTFLVILAGEVSLGPGTAVPRDTIHLTQAAGLRASPDARAALIRFTPAVR